MLYKLGVMSYGSFAGYQAEEYWEYVVQSELLQLALEALWAEAAESLLRAGRPAARHVIMLTDRDALDGKAYTRPVQQKATCTWSALLAELGRRLGRPSLVEADLTQRYQLGVVVLQTLAVVNGSLSHKLYGKYCTGLTSSNPYRPEDAEQAMENDEMIDQAYAEAYPRRKLCQLSNNGTIGTSLGRKVQAFVACLRRQIDRQQSV